MGQDLVLREADRTTVGDAAKKYKGSEPTIYALYKDLGQMDPADLKRLEGRKAGEPVHGAGQSTPLPQPGSCAHDNGPVDHSPIQ